MSRQPIQYIAPTKRKQMNKRRSVKIFLSRNGECCLCHEQIVAHVEKWYIEHPEAVNLGGSDNDADLWPAHYSCKPEKDAADIELITKRNTILAKNLVGERGPKRKIPQHVNPWGKNRAGNVKVVG